MFMLTASTQAVRFLARWAGLAFSIRNPPRPSAAFVVAGLQTRASLAPKLNHKPRMSRPTCLGSALFFRPLEILVSRQKVPCNWANQGHSV